MRRMFNTIFLISVVMSLVVYGLGGWLFVAVIHWLGTH